MLAPYYVAINSASNSIRLRLNPDEAASKKILDLMDDIERASASDVSISFDSISNLEARLVTSAQELLKKEWRRVKSGELAFRFAKYTAIGAFVLLATILFIWGLRDTNPNLGQKGLLKQFLDHSSSLPIKPKSLTSPAAAASGNRSVSTSDDRVTKK